MNGKLSYCSDGRSSLTFVTISQIFEPPPTGEMFLFSAASPTWQHPASGWRSHDFRKWGKVQTLRFVELCEQYGFNRGADTPVKAQMLPLHEWAAGDRAELQEMLDIAAS